MTQRLSSAEVIDILCRLGPRPAFIDVRSELEFAKAAVPGFVNLPILFQAERHEVGIAYKHEGQQAAIDRGTELVLPDQGRRIDLWRQEIARAPVAEAIIACWRGGLRSEIACTWLQAAGQQVYQVEGGYKGLRNVLLEVTSCPPPLVVITGLTGSGKTQLLQSLGAGAIDLEKAARHRGSAFGGWINHSQPVQATFENTLGLELIRQNRQFDALMCEDESRMIGAVSLPDSFFAMMCKAPRVMIDEPLAARTERIFRDYLEYPTHQGITAEQIQQKAVAALDAVTRRLSSDAAMIRTLMLEAFAKGLNYSDHEPWLGAILTRYYDRGYHYAARHTKDLPVLFQGDLASCTDWCKDYIKTRRIS